MDVACFCRSRYRFVGYLGACPTCDDYVTLGRVSDAEAEEMHAELPLPLGGRRDSSGESRAGQLALLVVTPGQAAPGRHPGGAGRLGIPTRASADATESATTQTVPID